MIIWLNGVIYVFFSFQFDQDCGYTGVEVGHPGQVANNNVVVCCVGGDKNRRKQFCRNVVLHQQPIRLTGIE